MAPHPHGTPGQEPTQQPDPQKQTSAQVRRHRPEALRALAHQALALAGPVVELVQAAAPERLVQQLPVRVRE